MLKTQADVHEIDFIERCFFAMLRITLLLIDNSHFETASLSWSHVHRALSVVNDDARIWYLTTASEDHWNVRTSVKPPRI